MEEVKVITTDELEEKLEKKEPVLLVDVREDEEVADGMIPGAKHIKMGDIPANVDYFDKDKEYIFICRSGKRSENVCMYLQDQGYNVRNLVGGMLDWHGKVE
ncbi:rhodanese-like domain-containing protein [Priestia koreensis]|uniref:Sulfurtransferase n=1 Tax=Priestia koreensis TaxID=284581 RepID=A0A0M0L7Y9_9BACI|nr:rhodanese-like domain-containing protein [Priestia koreensis]KOO46783.1 sulfurtransferase [Priestia koreensis]MCM3002859.1 rhodanese-like domain-containing protein [Priestia koreensis]UNL84547.1 rhodanese-like domain-containing protein [Priestia koreensis]